MNISLYTISPTSIPTREDPLSQPFDNADMRAGGCYANSNVRECCQEV